MRIRNPQPTPKRTTAILSKTELFQSIRTFAAITHKQVLPEGEYFLIIRQLEGDAPDLVLRSDSKVEINFVVEERPDESV